MKRKVHSSWFIVHGWKRGPARNDFAGLSCVSGGQALVTLLFFVLISVTITSAAIIVFVLNVIGTTKVQEGTTAYYVAESGIENALLRLLRDPSYLGETLAVGSSMVTISVNGSNPKTVVSVGQNGNFKRTVQAEMNYNNGYYTFSNWKEI